MGFGQSLEGCYKCMKYTLVIFNVLVLLIGAAVLGLGIYTLVSDYGADELASIIGNDIYKVGVYLLIAGGCITIVISFFGCCGAIMESRCLLALYFVIMLLLTLFFIGVTIVGFVFKDRITDQLREEVEHILVEDYGSDDDITKGWDRLQEDLKCCGVSGNESSNTSWAIYKLRSKWFTNNQDPILGTQYVPDSCCDPAKNIEECVGRANGDGKIPKDGPSVSAGSVATNPNLYTDGCFDELDDFLEDNAFIILGISLGALFIMLIGTIFSICLCVQIGREGYVV